VRLEIEEISKACLEEMVGWRYGRPYEFYDGDGLPPLNPERFFEARDESGAFVGFYYFEERESGLFCGLGLRPELTDQGHGLEFVRTGLEFGRERFGANRFVLDVAAFNERALRVYERAGFRITGRHVRHFERWGDVEFIDMELD
jgi:[ribosomal protein S18]-alanine N-acetyltransferase